ncbi:hypothetical protein Tco_0158316 [Tanacetum coccineum]
MRELAVRYKAEKVCHEEMVKMPLVDMKVLEVYTKSKKEYESHLKINLELLKKEKCHVKPNKTKRKGDCLYEATAGDSCEEQRDSRFGLRRDGRRLVPEYEERMRDGSRKMSLKGLQTDGQSERTFRTLENMFRACVRNLVVVGILTFREAEIGESKMIGLELEQETTKVVVIKERPKEAKDLSPWKGVVRFDKKGELAPSTLGTSVAGVFGGYTVNALIGLEAVVCSLRASAFILIRSLDQNICSGDNCF